MKQKTLITLALILSFGLGFAVNAAMSERQKEGFGVRLGCK